MTNWLNDTARELNDKIYQRRSCGPSITIRYNWKQEWLKLGLDHKISFVEYKREREQEWWAKKRSKK